MTKVIMYTILFTISLVVWIVVFKAVFDIFGVMWLTNPNY